MLVTAGYFNYSTFNSETQETYSEEIKQNKEQTNVGDAVLVSNNEEENLNTPQEKKDPQIEENTNSNLINNDNAQENIFQDIQTSSEVSQSEEQENFQNEVQTNQQINEENNDDTSNYYANSKLDRDKMYAEMISSYQEVLNNTNCSEAQKSIATQEIAKINNIKNAIMICENLILTKNEFQNCVILINDTSVNVVLKIQGGLNTESVAKIQNIISREIGTGIENIHITEK